MSHHPTQTPHPTQASSARQASPAGRAPGGRVARLRVWRRQARIRRALRIVAGLLAAVAGLVGLTSPVSALDPYHGAGINWGQGVHQNGAGNFRLPDGRYVYCAELFIYTDPSSVIPNYATVNTIPGKTDGNITVYPTSGDAVKRIAYVISRYGQTNDNFQAAAVAYAVWAGRSGNAGYQHQLSLVAASIGSAAVAQAHVYLNEAANWVNAGNGVGTWDSSVIHSTGPYTGELMVPVGATQVAIHNGRFSDGSNTKTWGGYGAPAGTVLTWTGVPPVGAGWDKYYRVTFTGKQYIPGSIQFAAGNGWQGSLMTTPDRENALADIYVDPDTGWQPVVASEVTSRFIRVGDTFTDTIRFDVLSGTGGVWRWRDDPAGRVWMPVTAKGTVYGPYLSDPAVNPSGVVPAGAPVAAEMLFTTVNPDGSFLTEDPTGRVFPVDTGVPASEQGFYTFVWEIIGDVQHDSVVGADSCATADRDQGCRVFDRKYYFSEGFGVAAETQMVQMRPHFHTDLGVQAVVLGGQFTDEVTVPARQNWLRDRDGRRFTLTLTGQAYLAQADSDGGLVESAVVPGDAVALGGPVTVVTDPNVNGQTLTSSAVVVPVGVPGGFEFVTMVWCVVDADQQPSARGVWEETCDNFGVASESARISRPEVTSQAQQRAGVYTPFTDVAVITGHVPADSTVGFEVFKQPVPGDPILDTDGKATGEVWDAALIGKTVQAVGGVDGAVCVAGNRVAVTGLVAVAAGVNRGQEYRSDPVIVDTVGTYWWVETLTTVDPDTGDTVVLHAGKCGLDNEMTRVVLPHVTSEATAKAVPGGQVRDTAIITGQIPADSQVGFEVFKQPLPGDRKYGADGEPVGVWGRQEVERLRGVPACTSSNRVAVVQPVPVAAGEHDGLRIVSAPVTVDTVGTYWWIETLTTVDPVTGDTVVLHAGKCGLDNEMTVVKQPAALPVTGVIQGDRLVWWAGGGLLACVAGFILLQVAHRRRARRIAQGVHTRSDVPLDGGVW